MSETTATETETESTVKNLTAEETSSVHEKPEPVVRETTETPQDVAETPAAIGGTQEPTDTPDSAQEPAEGTDGEGGEHPSAEAAKYRRRLRETETERDQLRGQVEGFQRAEAERLAEDILAKPSGMWAAGVAVGDLLDDDGHVDPEKVQDAAQSAADDLGLAPNRPGYVASEGGNPRPPNPGPSMEAVIRGDKG